MDSSDRKEKKERSNSSKECVQTPLETIGNFAHTVVDRILELSERTEDLLKAVEVLNEKIERLRKDLSSHQHHPGIIVFPADARKGGG
jgi:type I site-specific restriction-modification system R (restriction) subunit